MRFFVKKSFLNQFFPVYPSYNGSITHGEFGPGLVIDSFGLFYYYQKIL